MPFEEARDNIRSFNFKSGSEYLEAWRKGLLPENIPAKPDRTYKNKGWVNWGDFLGSKGTQKKKKNVRSLGEAKLFAKKMKVKNAKGWMNLSRLKLLPEDLPRYKHQFSLSDVF